VPETELYLDPPAWKRRGLALLLPLLAVLTATLAPAAVDTYKVWLREPGLDLLQVLHAGVFAVGMASLAAVAPGLVLGLLALVLTRNRDLSLSGQRRVSAAWGWLRRNHRHPPAAAGAYAAMLGLGLFLGAGYLVNYLFFTSFKNYHLAAMLLACMALALLGAAALGALVLRVGLIHAMRALARVPVIRALATVEAAVLVFFLALAGLAVYLVLSYAPIVRIIDWRVASYPAMVVGATAGVLTLTLWARHRRLFRGRRAGVARRLGLALWPLLFVGLWGYCLNFLGDKPSLRTALLRRGWGSAYAYDFLSVALDFDRDGYLSFFGGGDCDPFNASVHPGAMEIPGNHVDDNCFGGDLSAKHIRRAKRSFSQPLPPSLAHKKLSFVLITMDGLRADRLGVYGYKKATSPNIDAFARETILFERAYTQAPSTRYSIPSFMTSKYSSQVPRRNTINIPKPILPGALMMAEIFQKAGWRTGAALSYMVFKPEWGMNQGFDFYDNSQAVYYEGKGSPQWDKDQPYLLVEAAKKFLAQEQDRPFFLWVHFFEPHPPYVRRTDPIDFGSDDSGLYDGELRFGDSKIQQLLEALRKHPQYDRMVIAFSADHGRGMGHHGLATHGYDLFYGNLHVPLMFRVPGLKPRRIKNPVASLDLLPTFVNLAQIKDRFDFEGQSLVLQLTEGIEPDPERAIFSEVQVGFQNSHVINAITTRDWKLIYDVSFNTYQLFDLRKDPHELTNVADKYPAQLKRLKGALYKVMERATLPNIEEEIRSSMVSKVPLMPGVKRVNFDNEIEFLGYEVHPERPAAGGVTTINWYIKALRKPRKDYKVIVQLKGSKHAFFDAKHVPVKGLYPMSKWIPGKIVRDRQVMRLPIMPQEYEVWVGFGLGHEYLKPVKPLKVVRTCVRVGKFSTY
jgi:arylsulfatase A-like enzyme